MRPHDRGLVMALMSYINAKLRRMQWILFGTLPCKGHLLFNVFFSCLLATTLCMYSCTKARRKGGAKEKIIKGDPLTFLYPVPIFQAYNSVMKAYSSDQVI